MPVSLEARSDLSRRDTGAVRAARRRASCWSGAAYRSRGLVNPISNLPNLNALRLNREGRNQALVAARILNYEEIVATLAPEKERQLIEQIVARLNVGSPRSVLYQGDSGIFAWFEEPRQPIGNHLEALYSLFRNPARVSGLSIDLIDCVRR